MAQEIQGYLRDQMPVWRDDVPGRGERCAWRSWAASSTARASRKHADIGISLPGTFEEPVAPVFVDGALLRTLRGDGLVDEFLAILDDYVDRRYRLRERSSRSPWRSA